MSKELLDAANAVLVHFMPTFSDSRAVDDCLVQLAAAVAGVESHSHETFVRPAHWSCRTHGNFDAMVAVGCPECMRLAREALIQIQRETWASPWEAGQAAHKIASNALDPRPPEKAIAPLCLHEAGLECVCRKCGQTVNYGVMTSLGKGSAHE